MIIDPNITTYIYSIEPDGNPGLEALRIYAEEKNVPVIRREMEPFMRVLLQAVRPGRILEIGRSFHGQLSGASGDCDHRKL